MSKPQPSGRSREQLKKDYVRCFMCGLVYDQKEGHRCKGGKF